MSAFLAFVGLVAVPARAQSIYVYPVAVTAPRGSYQTCTGIVNGYNSKSVTWTTTGGTLVGVDAGTANEPATIALYTTTPGTYTVTGKSTVNSSLSGTCVVTITASPTITTGHPREMVTAAMLPGLQAKATSGNTMYQAVYSQAVTAYDAALPTWTFSTWSGSACVGGTPPGTLQSGQEVTAYLFAWISMVAPTSALRNQYGCAGRDVWVYEMANVMSGATFETGNDPSDNVNGFVLSGDWLMGGGYLSSSDITLQRQWNAFVLRQSIRADGGNMETGGCITPNATWNDPSEFSGDVYYPRCMGNNYTMSRMLYLVGLSTMFDDNTTDDPPLTNTCSATRYQVCPDTTAGSMHAYFHYFMGASMYMEYAHLEDPRVTDAAYQAAFSNPANPQCQYIGPGSGTYYSCLGDGRGGESAEGSWYAYSRGRLRDALNILHTTGNDDPMIWGPQASLGTSSYWDLLYIEDLEFLTGQSGDWYNYLTTGDTEFYGRTPTDFQPEASMMAADSYTGRTDRTSAMEWLLLNTASGGPLGTSGGCAYTCGFTALLNSEAPSQPIAYNMFIALPAGDPTSSLPPDPRPSLPTDLYNASYNQHQMLRNGWTGSNANSVFSYYCGNTLIDHELATCGRFDVYTGNEYITKGRTVLDYNALMSSATQSNEVSIMNITGSGASSVWYVAPTQGGEWFHGQQQDFTTLNHSELPAYAADIVDQTPLYNGWWVWGDPYDLSSYNDVTAASRSLISLRGTNQIVTYDRATTRSEEHT